MERSIAVWFANNTPVRLVWEGRRFRVNDTPTRLAAADVWWHPALTHPPQANWEGWRFQAVDGDGQTAVFDIKRFEAQHHWYVIAVHDYHPAEAAPPKQFAAERASKPLRHRARQTAGPARRR